MDETASTPELGEHFSPKKDKKKKRQVPSFQEGDFPDLLIKKESSPQPEVVLPLELEHTRSEQVSTVRRDEEEFPSLDSVPRQVGEQVHKKKKKKEKFVNVTEMFFKQEE